MQIIYNLFQTVLGLFLSRHIGKFNAGGRFYIHLGAALSQAEGHRVGSSRLLHQFSGHVLADAHKNHYGQHPGNQKAYQGRGLLNNLTGEFRSGFIKPLRQIGIVHHTGFIDSRFIPIGK